VGELDGRAGIVTGGGSGIGAATVRALARAGARVLAADLHEERARSIAEAAGEGVVAAAADVRRFEDTLALHDTCLETFGRIDFVVANAGVVDTRAMHDGDPEQWRAVVETNVLGVAHTIRAVLPTLREQRSGDVVLVASASGRISYVGEPVYIASKWAVVGLGHALRKETREYGVRVALIEPGIVDTPLARSTPAGVGELEKAVPLQPEDVARTIVFALSQPPHVGIREVLVQPVAQEL
jgi:NADP-dependent 3-hydroxy acid dehydrogenase YdfG